MKLVFVTQAIDADDPNLAAAIDMVRALARRANEVVVICDRFGRHDLPGNVAIETFAAAPAWVAGLGIFGHSRVCWRPDARTRSSRTCARSTSCLPRLSRSL